MELSRIVEAMGVSIPRKASFFVTYIMVDGWAGTASEILQPITLLMFHLRNLFCGKISEREEEIIMESQSIDFTKNLARASLYFVLGIGYAMFNPILLPFVDIFFVFAYAVYRHQV